MALIIDLTTEEEARLAAIAHQTGVEPKECARRLLTERLPKLELEPPTAEDPTLALFTKWEIEDAAKSADDVAREDLMWLQFEESINETRRALGMRQL